MILSSRIILVGGASERDMFSTFSLHAKGAFGPSARMILAPGLCFALVNALLGKTRLSGSKYRQNQLFETKKTSYSFRMCFTFALQVNNFRITAFCDEIFDIMFVTTVAKILNSRIVYSFAIKRVPNLRKIGVWDF